MIFDALRQISGTWLREIQPLVDAATLLHLPITPHEVLPREQDLETIAHVSIHFKLPHRITAIEDNASCVLLIDPNLDLRGLDEQRMFIECVPLDSDEKQYNDNPVDRTVCQSLKRGEVRGVYAVSAGHIHSPAQRAGTWLAAGELIWVVTGTTTRQHTTSVDFQALPDKLAQSITESAMRNAMTAIEEIIALDCGQIPLRR